MTKYRIAKKLGVSPQAVWKWYSGKSLPTQRNLIALAKVLGKTPEAVLGTLLRKRNAVGRRRKK